MSHKFRKINNSYVDGFATRPCKPSSFRTETNETEPCTTRKMTQEEAEKYNAKNKKVVE